MDSIIRGAFVYLFLLVVFRAAGNRSLSETTSFDLILLLIISETTQQAMIDSDNSVTNSLVLILTLVGIDVIFSSLKLRFGWFKAMIDTAPQVLVRNGVPMEKQMMRARVTLAEVLNSARQLQGLERLDQIKYAILEEGGDISIIPKQSAA